jgi:hypothetical protein
MSIRLQVVLDEREMGEIRQFAELHNLTVAEWVRQTLRAARQRLPGQSADRKIQVIRAAAQNAFPTADIDRMLAEIEAGYLTGSAL